VPKLEKNGDREDSFDRPLRPCHRAGQAVGRRYLLGVKTAKRRPEPDQERRSGAFAIAYPWIRPAVAAASN